MLVPYVRKFSPKTGSDYFIIEYKLIHLDVNIRAKSKSLDTYEERRR